MKTLYSRGALLHNLRELFVGLAESGVATKVLPLFFAPEVHLIRSIISDLADAEGTLGDDIEDLTPITEVIRALLIADDELAAAALLEYTPTTGEGLIDALVSLLSRVCRRSDAQLGDGPSLSPTLAPWYAPRRQTEPSSLLDILRRLAATRIGHEALDANRDALERLVPLLADIVHRPSPVGRVHFALPHQAAMLLAELGTKPNAIDILKRKPQALRQARAVIVANAKPADAAVDPKLAFPWSIERLLWLAVLRGDAVAGEQCCPLAGLPAELMRRVICYLDPVCTQLAPLYTIAGATVTLMIEREQVYSSEMHEGDPIQRYRAERLEGDDSSTADALAVAVSRLMRCDTGPEYLREGVVCSGVLSSYDPTKRTGLINLQPGEFAPFHTAELYRYAGRCSEDDLSLGQRLEFELQEVEASGVIGVYRAIRITAEGGGAVGARREGRAKQWNV